MSGSERRDDLAIEAALLEQLIDDRRGGRLAPLAHYEALHPGREAIVHRVYAGVENSGDGGGLGAGLTVDPASHASESKIGRFRILEEIGRGGQAVVYRAEDPTLRRIVALKVLTVGAHLADHSLRRFRREAEIASRLDHPGICPVYDTGIDGGRMWIAMRHVEGETLARRIAAARRSQGREPVVAEANPSKSPTAPALQVIAFMEKVARVLHAAHEAGVVHRDVKPGNIMVLPDGEPVVLDFGLARTEDATASLVTQTGDFLGTPSYMAPEQLGGPAELVDRRTDVWGLGVTLYEALTLKRPFEDSTRGGLEASIRSRDPSRVHRENPQVPRDVDAVVGKTLEKNPRRRYATAAEFADDLHRVLVHEPVKAKPAGPILRTERWVQRNPIAAAFLATLTVGLLLAVSLALALRRRTGEFNMLASRIELDEAQATERSLYPAWPEKAAALDEWLRLKAEPLCAELPRLRATVTELERRGRPQVESSFEADVAPRVTWSFADGSDEFLHRTLVILVADLEEFEGDEVKGARERLAWARRVGALTRGHPNARVTWAQARAAIAKADGVVASELYRRRPIDLEPQTGLVPIGMNPATKLWEFYDLRSAWDGASDPANLPIPQFVQSDARSGAIDVDGATGIVFVLLPGDTFWMGAQKDDPNGPNYDLLAQPDETPNQVTLAPFFLARHELTKGQWKRLARGQDPGFLVVGKKYSEISEPIGDAHPVESVTPEQCDEVLAKHGMVLPTEAQWEYGCRAGTTTAWFCGDDAAALTAFANFGQRDTSRAGSTNSVDRVGSYRANAFGLHDVHGNVSEWCRDHYGDYGLPCTPDDGLREVHTWSRRVWRGGYFTNPLCTLHEAVRSARRPPATWEAPERSFGLRAARTLAVPTTKDESRWIRRKPMTRPPARFFHAMAYDEARQRIVLFGGTDGWYDVGSAQHFDDTWEWDGATWTKCEPAAHPTPRELATMAYDPEGKRIVLFGGRLNEVFMGDTWAWDGSNWTLLNGDGPAASGWQVLASDDATKQLLVLTGDDPLNGSSAATWRWDGAAWSRAPGCDPTPALYHPMAARDGERHRLVVVGRTRPAPAEMQTWEWDGACWQQRSTRPHPSVREYAGFAWDPTRRRTILFGGGLWRVQFEGALADTWEWNGEQWTRRSPIESPPARYGHGMAYDTARKRIVLFGGYSWTGPLSGPDRPFPERPVYQDTWEFVEAGTER